MALDPRLSLAVQTPDIGRIFSNVLTNVGALDTLKENRELAPLRQQALIDTGALREQQTEAGRLGNVGVREQQRFNSVVQGANELLPFLQNKDFQGATIALDARRARLVQQGLPTQDTDDAIALLNSDPAMLQQRTQQAVQLGQQLANRANTSNLIQSSQFVPGKGFAALTKGGEASFIPVGGLGETAEDKRAADLAKSVQLERTKSLLQGKSAAVKAAVTKGAQAFDKIQPLSKAIANYDEAIAAIDAGAETGVIDSFLPSFRTASIELDNVVKRLGLDVVGNTTFGALSESELKFALNAAIPDTLQPAELKEWLIAKRNSQRKVKERVEEAASFLSDGTHTLKDWIEFDQAKQINQQSNTVNTNEIIRIDEQGNIIQ